MLSLKYFNLGNRHILHFVKVYIFGFEGAGEVACHDDLRQSVKTNASIQSVCHGFILISIVYMFKINIKQYVAVMTCVMVEVRVTLKEVRH